MSEALTFSSRARGPAQGHTTFSEKGTSGITIAPSTWGIPSVYFSKYTTYSVAQTRLLKRQPIRRHFCESSDLGITRGPCLRPNGTLLIVGAPSDPIEVSPLQLIFGRKSIQGWSSGIPTDSEDTLRFAAMTGVRPMIEKYPLANAAEAYARMMSGKAEFRVVLTM